MSGDTKRSRFQWIAAGCRWMVVVSEIWWCNFNVTGQLDLGAASSETRTPAGKIDRDRDLVDVPAAGSLVEAMNQARAKLEQKNREEARAYFTEALAHDPEFEEALMERGKLNLNRFALDAADQDFTRLLKVDPGHRQARLSRATVWIHMGRWDEAVEELDSLLKLDPKNPYYLATRGRVEEVRGNREACLEWRTQFLLADPDNKNAHRHFTNAMRAFGRGHEIGDVLKTLGEQHPEKWASLEVFRAKHAESFGELLVANEILTDVLEKEPDHYRAMALLARITTKKGDDYEKAEELINAAIAGEPDNAEHHAEHAHVLYHLKREDEAWAAFKRCYLLNPGINVINYYQYTFHDTLQKWDGKALDNIVLMVKEAANSQPEHINEIGFHLSRVYRRVGFFENDFAAMNDLIGRAPGPGLLAERAHLRKRKDEFAEALKDLDHAIRLNPGYARAWNDRGFVLEKLNRLEEAAASYIQAALLDPHYTNPANNLIRVRELQQKPRQAAEDFADLARRRPSGRYEYWLWRGDILGHLNRPHQQLAESERVLAEQPFHVRAMFMRADALYSSGRYDEATDQAERLLQLQHDHTEALALLGTIAVALGDTELAQSYVDLLYGFGRYSNGRALEVWIHIKSGRFEAAKEYFNQFGREDFSYSRWIEYRAYNSFVMGDWQVAADDFAWLINRFGVQDSRYKSWLSQQYMALLMMGKLDEAEHSFRHVDPNNHLCQWPYTVFKVYMDQVPPEVAIAKSREVAFDMLQKVHLWPHRAFGYEVRTQAMLALFAESRGDFDYARNAYKWIEEHRDRLSVEWYHMATNRLQLIANQPNTGKLPSINDPMPQSDPDLERGLLAWLPLAEDLKDHSHFARDVEVTGDVKIENGVARFPGNGHHLELPHIPLRRREFSVSMWVKTVETDERAIFFSQWEKNKCGHSIHLQLRDQNRLFMSFFRNDVLAPVEVQAREDWNHYVFQYTRWRQQIWLNGQLLVERLAEPLEAKSGTARIGGFPDGWQNQNNLNGWMRDFRIYDRALRSEEINQLAGMRAPTGGATITVAGNQTIPARNGVVGSAVNQNASIQTVVDPRPFLQIAGNELIISGPPIQVYDLQATRDLNLDWSPVTTLTNSTGQIQFVDEQALYEGQRFYRVELIRNTPIATR